MSSRMPIKNTCPEIDGYISKINRAISSKSVLVGADYDDLMTMAIEMSDELSNCVDYLEKLRSSNDTLREWGKDEADEVDELKSKVLELENELENTVIEMREEATQHEKIMCGTYYLLASYRNRSTSGAIGWNYKKAYKEMFEDGFTFREVVNSAKSFEKMAGKNNG